MLAKLSRFVGDQRKRWQLNQALSQVEKYLRTIERRRVDFERLCSDLRRQRRKVTDEELLKAREKFADVWAYLDKNQMFAIDSQLEQIFEAERDALTELHGYSDILARFINLQKSFQPAMLDAVRDEINHTIVEYERAAVIFADQLDGLKAEYIAESDVRRLQSDYQYVYEFFKDADGVEPEIGDFLGTYEALDSNSRTWNEQFITRALEQHQSFLDDIDGKALDSQQRLAVLTDQDNLLVLAGAGSGKTLTIAGKVKFLVEVQNVNPQDILLISFTRDAAREMGHRINGRLGVNVDVVTFHKLGLSIIAAAEHGKPDIANEMESFLKEYLKNTVYGDKEQLQNLLEFFSCYMNIPKDVSQFDSLGDYYDHCKNTDFETVKGKVSKASFARTQSEQLGRNLKTVAGESVKSLEEVMVANFLFLRGVAYEYERPYEHDTRDEAHSQYRPDFYLPEYGIYIEHFGVNEQVKAPWLSEIEEAKYIEGMDWKRSLHGQHKTTLIESFSYYNKQGVLLEKLEQNLLKHGVQFREVDYKEVFDAVFEQTNNNYLAEFMKLLGTFISLFKSNR